ncbi:NAD-dependent epimerase/dehydratase family protein [Phenylobacterium sp.]|uniref:NAD-dependent epimerase/dehydratase family protein n=1 Tax=Phenylobacterium sp. TaxID=1871053 RepID=UPI0035B4C32D
MPTTPKDVVLGASGFIGTRLVARLSQAGRRVVAVDVVPPRDRVAGVDYVEADVREPLDGIDAAGASVIYNLAAVHRTPGHEPHEYYDTNVPGALHAARLADEAGVGTIVFTSSISVYGPCEKRITEASPLRPISDYGRSKHMAELVHQRWLEERDGRKLVVVRPGVVFGPGERGNYTHLARALRRGLFLYPGRRDTVKSGGYVDELLDTIAFALADPETFVLYNFAYPDEATTEEIVRTFARVSGTPAQPATVPAPLLYAAAMMFEAANALGLSNPIHRDRVIKLVQSTRIVPQWLLSRNYRFSSNLETALRAWAAESDGKFV